MLLQWCVNYSFHRYRHTNLTKVRPLFTLSYRASDNSPLLIMFSANYIDQSNRDFYATEGILETLTFWPFCMRRLHTRGERKTYQQNYFHQLRNYCNECKTRYLSGRNHDVVCTKFIQSSLERYQTWGVIRSSMRYDFSHIVVMVASLCCQFENCSSFFS